MQQKAYYIGIDMGTQGIRCGIIDEHGDILTAKESKYSIHFPKPGHATQKPAEWLRSFDEAISNCIDHVDSDILKYLKGISICATASTVIPVDREGNALTDAILWMDNRAKKEAEEINRTEHKVLNHCGKEVSVEWLIPKTLWIKRNIPDVYNKAFKIVEQQDFMNYYLTGSWCSSVCQATCKGNYVEGNCGWNEDYFNKIGLQDFRSKINIDVLKLGEKAGTLLPAISKKYGLPEDLPVFQGGIDAHIAMLGMGVSCPGDMGIIMGTSFVHLVLSETPVCNNGIWGPYKNAVVPGLYCLEGGQVSAGSITKWFLNEFNVMGENPYMVMANEAKKSPIGSKGVVTLDFFQGNRTPYKDPNAKGVFYGLTLNHTRGDIYRSIMEGIAFGTRNIIDTITSNEENVNNIMVCGGVTKNPEWLQIIADVTGKPITLTKNSSDGGILGCAIVSAVGSGYYSNFEEAVSAMVKKTNCISPNMQAHGSYLEFYNKYLELYEALKKTMSE